MSTEKRRLGLLATTIADFESEFGEITAEEIATQRRLDREQATVVRGPGRRAGGHRGSTAQ